MKASVEQEMRELLKASLAKVKDLKAQVAALEGARSAPIAIIGLGCRFPGGADDVEQFWDLLAQGRDAVQPLAPRWEMAGSPPSSDLPRWAGLLTGDLDRFDADFFGIAPREARSLDPQQRLLLEVAWEALEDAGIAPTALHGSRTSVFIGECSTDYARQVERQPATDWDAYTLTGSLASVAAGRLSYVLGLQGPCLTLDTACSSSLVAIHLACQSLRAQNSEVALAGGVNILLSPETMRALARTQSLSPDGRCKTFDAAANGFVRGEGCGLVVLKRLADAQRDGDRIWAVIRGSAINHDGRSTGLTAPNVLSQEALLREALQDAQVAPAEVDFVETHGTGTSLGDPIEVEALRSVLGAQRADGTRCLLGAVKTNLGHLEAAAGVAGLIKTVLALAHERIPRNLHFRVRNPRLRMDDSALALATDSVPWPRGDRPRLAGVSSFGISGTNAHVVLQEAPLPPAAPDRPARSAELVLLSAKSEAALAGVAAGLHAHLQTHPGLLLGDVAFGLARRRAHLEQRLALPVTSHTELQALLHAVAQRQKASGAVSGRVASSPPKIVFVFPGQGSQWLGMGRTLLREEPVFRAAFEACDRAITAEAGLSVLAELDADGARSQIGRIDVVQPLLFTMEVALAALWRYWGVNPDCVVGHSMGEVAAAHVAGILTLEDAARIICHRSRLLRGMSGRGAMALVDLSVAETEKALAGYEDRLSVAVSNSPRSTVVSGDPAALDVLLAAVEGAGVFCRRVKVDVASHSPQMDPLLADLVDLLRDVRPQPARIPLRSTVTAAPVQGPELGAPYWARNLRAPVLFARAIQDLAAEGHTIFVELSPHPILLPSVQENLQAQQRDGAVVASMRRDADERAVLLGAIGELWVRGVDVDLTVLFPNHGRVVPLPTYRWQRERHWVDASASAATAVRGPMHPGGHPLIGLGCTLSTQPGTRVWETALDIDRLPWMRDHKVQGVVVFPGAGTLEMALAAGAQSWASDPFQVADVSFLEMLSPDLAAANAVQVVTTTEQPGRLRFQVASPAPDGAHGAWTVHARGSLVRGARRDPPPRLDLAALRARLGAPESAESLYSSLGAMGLEYGPTFRGLVELQRGEGQALARVRRTEAVGDVSDYHVHPAVLDACFQAVVGTWQGDVAPWVPVHVGGLRLFQKAQGDLFCYVTARADEQGPSDRPARRSADLFIVDAQGDPVLEVTGLVVQRLLAGETKRAEDDLFLELTWEAAPPPAPTVARGRFLVLGGGELGARLCAAIVGAGHAAVQAVAGAGDAGSGDPLRLDDASVAGMQALLARAFGGQAPSAVVHLRSLEARTELSLETLEPALARGYDSVLHTVQALASTGGPTPRLWLVSRGAQAAGNRDVAVAQAPMIGLGRVIAMEHPELRCARVDLDPRQPQQELAMLMAELLGDGPEHEVALRGTERHLARLVHASGGTERAPRMEPRRGRPFRLTMARPGVFDDLRLSVMDRRPPGRGEVEIEVVAAGLNFIDVMKATGIYPGLADGPMVLGSECAGRIVAVGEGVHGFGVGDRVLAVAVGSFATHITVSAQRVAPWPDTLTAAQGATVAAVFATAWYALVQLARVRPGERVLIHSASGGTGLAAVQIARHCGAEIFATAGSPEKRAWLREQGIAHVMDSRSLDFAAEIQAATGGQGVDVVLNSLSGAAIEASISVLAEDGRFIELGKTEIYADRPLQLGHFKKSLTYSAVDLAGLAERRPERFATLLKDVTLLLAQGTLAPLPVEVVPITRAADSFRKMAQAQHIGKLALLLDDSAADVQVVADRKVTIRRDRSYLVTGGLGGLGLSVAGWLADQGAGRLILLGRTGVVSSEQQAAVAALQAQGTAVTIARVDVADGAGLQRVLADVAAAGPPLGGVVHAAGSLEDGLLAEQTPAKFRRVMAPKILGALHLHTLTQGCPLDFFVMYSSIAGLLGSPGQGNYAAANTFLDALAHHRRGEGLPAVSIDWGAFAEVGLAAAQDNRGARLAARGLRSITPQQGLVALRRILDDDREQVGVTPLDIGEWTAAYPMTASSPMLSRILKAGPAGTASASAGLLSRLANAEGATRTAMLEEVVRTEIARVLRMPEGRIDAGSPLIRLGLDSLMGLELRHRLQRATTVDVPVSRMLTGMTAADLVRHLNEQIPHAADVSVVAPKDNNSWLDTEL